MTRYLVGIDGSPRGKRAASWAANQAHKTDGLVTLLTVVDPVKSAGLGFDTDAMKAAAEEELEYTRNYLTESYPNDTFEGKVLVGSLIETLVDAAGDYDAIVLGSHHGITAGNVFGQATALRVSVSVHVPTVVVPSDWRLANQGTGIVVGVGPDDSANAAVDFAVRRALATNEELKLISGWGLPAFLYRPANAMGGGIGPVGRQFQENLDAMVERLVAANPGLKATGEAVSASNPARAILEASAKSEMLVLGTHSYGTFGRALFGSTTHSVLTNLVVPTVVVPCK